MSTNNYTNIMPHRGSSSTMSSTKAALVLNKGELFLEYPDTGVGTGLSKIKIGDGTTAYTSLPYAIGDTSNDTVNFTTDSSTAVSQALDKVVTGAKLTIDIAALKQAVNLTGTAASNASSTAASNTTAITDLQNSLTLYCKTTDVDSKDNSVKSALQTEIDNNASCISNLNNQVTNLANIKIVIIDYGSTLPVTGTTGTMYFVAQSNSGTNSDMYFMYIWNAGGYYNKIGVTAVDLTGYAKTADVTSAINAATSTLNDSITTNTTNINNIISGASTVAYANNAGTAQYVLNTSNSTCATHSINADTATYAVSAGSATSATSATNATSAGTATSAVNATNATSATNAATADAANSSTYAKNAGTADYASTADYATNAATAENAITATNAGTAQYAVNASSSDYAKNASTAVYAKTTGSASSANTATNADSATYATNAGTAKFATSATYAGTSDYAKSAGTTSYALTADKAGTSTYAVNAGTAAYATKASTADYVAHTATADTADSATNADTAEYAKSAGTADYATTASYASTADYAKSATSAANATTATNSGTALYALDASSATNATNASTASYLANGGTVSNAASADYAKNADTAAYATNASSANYASTAGYVAGMNLDAQSVTFDASTATTPTDALNAVASGNTLNKIVGGLKQSIILINSTGTSVITNSILCNNKVIAPTKRYIQGYESITLLNSILPELDRIEVTDLSHIHVDGLYCIVGSSMIHVAETTIAVSVATEGVNYYVEVDSTGAVTCETTKTNSDSKICIGGFHVGRVRTTDGNTTAGATSIGVVPNSVWTLNWRPRSISPDAMVYLGGNKWGDIYLTRSKTNASSGIGGAVYESSAKGSYPATGTEGYNWYTFAENLGKVGKRLPSYAEFCHASDGSPAGLSGSNANAWTATSNTGRQVCGYVANATSNLNIRDMVGNVWKWNSDTFQNWNGATNWSFAWNSNTNVTGHGGAYGPGTYQVGAFAAGCKYPDGEKSGSRVLMVDSYPSYPDSYGRTSAWAISDMI